MLEERGTPRLTFYADRGTRVGVRLSFWSAVSSIPAIFLAVSIVIGDYPFIRHNGVRLLSLCRRNDLVRPFVELAVKANLFVG